eukprot:UN04305
MYHDGPEPSMDVINTIIASYAASTSDDRDSRHQMGLGNLSDIKSALPRDESNRYGRYNEGGCRPEFPEQKSSTPVKRYEGPSDSPNQFVHPFAMKLQKEGTGNHIKRKNEGCRIKCCDRSIGGKSV